METAQNQHLLTRLFQQATVIRSTSRLLEKAIYQEILAGSFEREHWDSSFGMHQKNFDDFSVIANQIDNLEDPEEFQSLKQEISQWYQRFSKLRKLCQSENPSLEDCREFEPAEDDPEEDLQPDISPEELQEEDGPEQEDAQEIEEEVVVETVDALPRKKKRRVIRPPKIPVQESPSQPEIQSDLLRKQQYDQVQEQIREENERLDARQEYRERHSLSLSEEKSAAENRRKAEKLSVQWLEDTQRDAERRLRNAGYSETSLAIRQLESLKKNPELLLKNNSGPIIPFLIPDGKNSPAASRSELWKHLSHCFSESIPLPGHSYRNLEPHIYPAGIESPAPPSTSAVLELPKRLQSSQPFSAPKPNILIERKSPKPWESAPHSSVNAPAAKPSENAVDRIRSKQTQSAERANKHQQTRYKLKSIESNLGNGISMTAHNLSNRAVHNMDNDVVRFAVKADYYRYVGKTAYNLAAGVASHPAAQLRQAAAVELSPRQMSHYNAQAIRQHRQLKQQITVQKSAFKALSTGTHDAAQRETIQKNLSGLRSQLPGSYRAAHTGKRVQRVIHEQKLDQQLLNALSDSNGKTYRSGRRLEAAGNQFLTQQRKNLTKKFGQADLSRSPRSIDHDIRQLKRASTAAKSQIQLLSRQGHVLSDADRKRLIQLKDSLKKYGAEIGKLENLRNSLQDLNHFQNQFQQVIQRSKRLRYAASSTLGLVRSTLMRPMYEDSNTANLATAVNVAFDPTLHKAVTGTVKLPGKVVIAGAKKVAPDLYTSVVYKRDQIRTFREEQKKAIHRKRKQRKQAGRKASPTANKKAAVKTKTTAGTPNRKVSDRVAYMKKWASNTRLAQVKRAIQQELKTISAFFQKCKAMLSAVSAKAVLIILLCILLVATIPAVLGGIATLCSSVIMAPGEPVDGKIDLTPYTQIYMAEKHRFDRERNDVEQAFYDYGDKNIEQFLARWNKPPKSYLKTPEDEIRELANPEITVEYIDEFGQPVAAPSENHREIIAMMAVRMQNDLEDPLAQEYMTYMSRRSREIKEPIHQSLKFCGGCVEVKIQTTPEPEENQDSGSNTNPGGGSHVVPGIRSAVKPGSQNPSSPDLPDKPKEPVYETITVCPGHPEMKLQIHVLTLDELLDADDFNGLPDWEGWNEENRDWLQMLLDMDWDELYTGFHIFIAGGALGPISSADEAQIWDSLNSFTGNPYATAGIMGNLVCESRLSPTNLQDSYEPVLGFTDESYTAAVDSGTYQNFVNDAAGYGIAQWTYFSRKEKLLNLAKQRGTSIGDLGTQLQMLKNELSGMKSTLAGFSNVEDASNYILDHFEQPRYPEATRAIRINYSSYYYNKYVLGVPAEGDLTWAQKEVCNIAMNSGAYGIPARGGYCQAWAAHVYAKAGFALDNSGSARQSGDRYGVSSDFSITPPGAAVYGYSSSKYGHVGIYVGGGKVYHNIGGVAVDTLADWIRKYNGYCWGWEGGTDLTQQ